MTGTQAADAVPYVFDLDAMVQHFIEVGDYPTAEQVQTAGSRVGRNAYPALVCDLFTEDLLTTEAAMVAVPDAWSMCEFPNRYVERPLWRMLFDHAGYTVNGEAASRPTEPVMVWRGAIPGHRDGWAWTDDIEMARWFAAREFHKGAGRVYTLEAEPWRLLARITDGREESEYVVDTDGLAIADG